MACDDQEQIRPPPEASRLVTPLVISQTRALESLESLEASRLRGSGSGSATSRAYLQQAQQRVLAAAQLRCQKKRQKHARGSRCSFASLLPGLVPCSPRRGGARRPQAAAARLQRVCGQHGLCLSWPVRLHLMVRSPPSRSILGASSGDTKIDLPAEFSVDRSMPSSDWIIGKGVLLLAPARF